MAGFLTKVRGRIERWLPVDGYHCDRPLVLLQSDDWGRVGIRDREGLEQLKAAGLQLGEKQYDSYTLETAEDLAALQAVLRKHRDSVGNHPCVQMNFLLFNLDFEKMATGGYSEIHLKPLSAGLPGKWRRSGLVEAYRAGMDAGVFWPAVHGTTHFCRPAVERSLAGGGDRTDLLRTLWQAETPYIHWRMPWVGYEYWDPEQSEEERFLPAEVQRELIGAAVGEFAKLFSLLPRSACAPGYRANDDTWRAWSQHGVRVAQDGPENCLPPHFDRHGMLHLSRTVEFEPATDAAFSVAACLRQAEAAFERGVPAVVSVHSINFHSTVKDYRGATLAALDEFLQALEAQHSDLLYLRDEDLDEAVRTGSYRSAGGGRSLNIVRKSFTPSQWAKQGSP